MANGFTAPAEVSNVFTEDKTKMAADSCFPAWRKVVEYENGVAHTTSDEDDCTYWTYKTTSCRGYFTEKRVYVITGLAIGDPEDATLLLKTIVSLRKKYNDADEIFVWLIMEAYEKPEMYAKFMNQSAILPWQEGFEEALAAAGFTGKEQKWPGDWYIHYVEQPSK